MEAPGTVQRKDQSINEEAGVKEEQQDVEQEDPETTKVQGEKKIEVDEEEKQAL